MSCPWKRALERGLNNGKEICHQEDYRLPRGSAGNYRNRAVCSCHSDQPSFLTPKSLMEMLKNNAVTMVMSLGMLCVMLVGGIDISIMSTLALSGMSIGMLLKYGHITSTLLAFIIAMAIGIACGLVVGLVISRANVPPIIATMGFMYIYRAMGYLVSHGGEWASAAALGDFKNFATTNFLGINKVIWVIIVCYVVFFFFMKWTRTGRRIYAVGSTQVQHRFPVSMQRISTFLYM